MKLSLGRIENFPRLNISIKRGEAFHLKDADPSKGVCDALHRFIEELSVWLDARYNLPFSIGAFILGKEPAGKTRHMTNNVSVTATNVGSDSPQEGTLLAEIFTLHPNVNYPRIYVFSTNIVPKNRCQTADLDRLVDSLLQTVIAATCDDELIAFWQSRNDTNERRIIHVTF